jgi:membrane-bound serine protease (ClpP class)
MLVILALDLMLIFLPWRRRARVGVETLIGTSAMVITPLVPDGQVKVNGEIWQAHSQREVRVGEAVLIRAVNGLTLEVEPHSR